MSRILGDGFNDPRVYSVLPALDCHHPIFDEVSALNQFCVDRFWLWSSGVSPNGALRGTQFEDIGSGDRLVSA